MPVVPIHPLSTPDPLVMRWVIPDGLLSFSGEVAHAPALLQALLNEGTLASVQVAPGSVFTLLADGHSWSAEGARVRTALLDALNAPGRWRGAQTAHAVGPDEALEVAAREIADGPVGKIARSHGGSFVVRSVHDGVVTVGLAGACHDCPAAVVTMHARFEHLLRRRCPWLKEVRQADGAESRRGSGARLPLAPLG